VLGRLCLSKTIACKLIKLDSYYGHRNVQQGLYSFWPYKVYADICVDSVERRRQTTMGWCVNASAAHWHSLILFAVLVIKSAGSSDIGFERDGCRFC